jgi:hypothetical protein
MRERGRIGCSHCNWKGYKKYPFWNGEKEEVTVSLCSNCKDIRGYSAYIKSRYGKKNNLVLLNNGESLADVIDFYKFKDLKELSYLSSEECLDLAKKQLEEFGEIPRIKESES